MVLAAGTDSVGSRSPVFLSLLPPLGADRRLALLLVGVSALMFLVLAPFAKSPLAPMPGFIPVYQSALFISDAITAALLFGQYSIQRTRGLLLLATAYLFTALSIVPHTLSFPGLFAPGGLMGSGPQTTVWLYMPWHAGFPLLVMAYALFKGDNTQLAAPRGSLLAAVAMVIVAVLGFTLLTTAGHDLLPQLLLSDNTYTPAMFALILGVWALSLLAVLVLWLRRPHSALDLWMMVVMVAWSCDVGLSAALNAKRFDLGFYAGRAFGLMAAGFVLIMLLLETRALYARLARNLASQRDVAEEELRRSQELYRTLFETNPYPVSVSDRETQRIVAVNDAAVAQYGWSREEFLSLTVSDVIPPEELPAVLAKRQEFSSKISQPLQGLQHRKKDGTVIDVEIVSRVIQYDGRPAVLTIATDVSERLRTERERHATEEQLRQSQKMEAVGQLTGGIAHDFNNILMVIQANVEELQEDESLSPARREQLDNIAESSQRAAELTHRLLAFSRKQRLQPQPTNLTDLVAGIGKLLHRALGEQIEVEAILADDLWTTNIDRAQLEAALVNLSVNARDAMPGGGRLLIETVNSELDQHYAALNPGLVPGQYVMLAVSDTGTGISAELLSKVFDPFFTTKDVGKGTGLGLSMVYGFIKQSNGHIKIYSEVGRGTTIRLYLPRSDAPVAGDAVSTAPAKPRGTERILLVEDDEQVRAAVVAQLRSLGYAATEAAGGQAALDRLEGGDSFDLILTDVVMPGLDGPQLAKIVAARWPAMKMIFMSGYSENAAVNHGRVTPDVRILSKPFSKIDLAERLRETLDGS